MQKKSLFIPLIALTFLISPVRASAPASPSPSPKSSPLVSPSPASDQDITETLKQKIIANLDSSDATPASTARAYIGVVKDVIKDTVVIEDKSGKKDITLEGDTVILRSPGNTVIKPENIRIDDSIIAMGFPSDTDVLTGRRLIVSTDPINAPNKSTAMGTITKLSKTAITLKLADKDQVLSLTPKTIFKSPVGSIDYSDLALGDTLIYTATNDSTGTVTATLIMRTQTASIGE